MSCLSHGLLCINVITSLTSYARTHTCREPSKEIHLCSHTAGIIIHFCFWELPEKTSRLGILLSSFLRAHLSLKKTVTPKKWISVCIDCFKQVLNATMNRVERLVVKEANGLWWMMQGLSMTNVPRNAFVLHSSVSTVCSLHVDHFHEEWSGGGTWRLETGVPHVLHRLTSIMNTFSELLPTAAPSAASISHKLCSSACSF